jgi:hypothetical protein
MIEESEYVIEWEDICKKLSIRDLDELELISKKSNLSPSLTKEELCKAFANNYQELTHINNLFPNGVTEYKVINRLFRNLIKELDNNKNEFLYQSLMEILVEREDDEENNTYIASVSTSDSFLPNNPVTNAIYIKPCVIDSDSISQFDITEDKVALERGSVYSHCNVLIIQYKNNEWISYRFEPYYSENNKRIKEIDNGFAFLLEQEEIKLESIGKHGPGIQTLFNGELCVFYCLYFVYWVIKSKGSIKDAIEQISHLIKKKRFENQFLHFIHYLFSIIKKDKQSSKEIVFI